MSDNQFTCASCGGTFEKCCSYEEASKEFEDAFGRPLDESDDIVLVCDDCYKAFMGTL